MTKFIKRIGTKGFKYQFEVAIQKIQTDLKENCQLFVQWQRGPHKVETRRVPLDPQKGEVNLTDKLNMPATLYLDTKTKKYLEKKCHFKVMISYPKVNKLIAGCEVNLANYPNNEIQEKK